MGSNKCISQIGGAFKTAQSYLMAKSRDLFIHWITHTWQSSRDNWGVNSRGTSYKYADSLNDEKFLRWSKHKGKHLHYICRWDLKSRTTVVNYHAFRHKLEICRMTRPFTSEMTPFQAGSHQSIDSSPLACLQLTLTHMELSPHEELLRRSMLSCYWSSWCIHSVRCFRFHWRH